MTLPEPIGVYERRLVGWKCPLCYESITRWVSTFPVANYVEEPDKITFYPCRCFVEDSQ